MSIFEKSEWKKKHKNSLKMLIIIFFRNRLFKIMKSLYNHFLRNNIKNKFIKVLDIGCGDMY